MFRSCKGIFVKIQIFIIMMGYGINKCTFMCLNMVERIHTFYSVQNGARTEQRWLTEQEMKDPHTLTTTILCEPYYSSIFCDWATNSAGASLLPWELDSAALKNNRETCFYVPHLHRSTAISLRWKPKAQYLCQLN